MIGRIARLARQVARSTAGNACIETALVAPVFLTLLMGGVDGTRYVLVGQKTERAAATIADLVSQSRTLTQANFSDLFYVVGQVMEPFDATGSHIKIIVTCVNNPSGTPKVGWQQVSGTATASSTLGSTGANAVLPGNLTVRTGDNALLGEVFYTFEPLFVPQIFPESTLYRWSVFQPRFSPLC